MNVRVNINRGQGNNQFFIGKVIASTNLFYKVTWDNETGKNDVGEWFAKKSECVNCKLED